MKLIAFISILVVNSGFAAVVQNDAVIATPSSMPDEEWSSYLVYPYQFILTQTAPPNSGMFSTEITPETTTDFTFTPVGIALTYAFFNVTSGTVFDSTYVGTHSSFVNNSNDPGQATLSLAVGASTYIGYWADILVSSPGPDSTDLYGWALLENQSGSLTVIDSATSTVGGIIIGTLQEVPEPSVFGLAFFGVGSILTRRKRS